MSDDDKKKFKRKPLSRSRRMGSRRRRKSQEEDDDESEEEGGEEESSDDDSSDDDSEQTQAITTPIATARIPGPSAGPGPDLGGVGGVGAPPPAEKWARTRGSVRRFTADFSKFLFGLGQTAHQQGQAFGRDYVKPFSQALVEAAISLAILFVMGVIGLRAGIELKLMASEGAHTLVTESRPVQPGQSLDQSFFSEGFESEDVKQRATNALTTYLDALKSSDYRRAYQQLSEGWQQDLSFEAFERGYQEAQVKDYDIGRSEWLNDSQLRLHAEFSVREKGRDKKYRAVYLLQKTSQGWKLDAGSLDAI